MDIRQVEQKEIGGVLDLIDEYDRPRSPRPSDEDMRRIYNAILESGGCVVGAFSARGMVGTCTVNVCANLSWCGRPHAIIENVIVSKSHRNQGIGKAILKYATEFAQQAGCYKAALMTGSKDPATHSFYESSGFSASKQGYQVRFNAGVLKMVHLRDQLAVGINQLERGEGVEIDSKAALDSLFEGIKSQA